MDFLPLWVQRFLPILGLLVVIAFVIRRLPRVDLGHSQRFMQRRLLNWLPLGMTYAFLYMARYNINAAKNAGLMTKEELGIITFWGALTYGVSFLVNGPLTDRFGGRKTILAAAAGSSIMNLAMGWMVHTGRIDNIVLPFSILYAANMYFQSFGAVSIVKVNASWFHVRERGVFGGIFGILISLGIYFAFDWGRMIVESMPLAFVYFVPAAILAAFFVIDFFLVFDRPGLAGHSDFDTADASSGDNGPPLTALQVAGMMLRHPVIVTIALIEFCSGFVRGGVMKWTYVFLKETELTPFVYHNWGLLLCCAGILGGVFAGTISDRLFNSRRGPSAAILYSLVSLGLVGAWALIATPAVGLLLLLVMLSVIGVHGMLSGTASMDFGGRRNAGIAVGLIDGMVYLGFAAQSLLLAYILPKGELGADPNNWKGWIFALIPAAFVGYLLSRRIWHAVAHPKKRAEPQTPANEHAPTPTAEAA